ncbi:MAG: tetratricopeptide repeat protein [Verrucomicrobiales bacterium]|nr:tetratricopeptide repeat protein [Verrucomicrobiales bacterium]
MLAELPIHPGAVLSALSFALLFGWIFWRWSRKSEDPPLVLGLKVGISLVLTLGAGWSMLRMHPIIGVPLAAAAGVVVGILWGRNIGGAIAKPFASMYDGGDEEPELKPFYAIAEAHRKQGRFQQAIGVIEEQLSRFPDDPQGWLMLAEIRCRNLGEWELAEEAINAVALNESLAVPTRAKSLQALSDWYLDIARNMAEAERLLGRIQELFPGTPEAAEAAQRIAHLGDENWRKERGSPSTLRVKATDQRLGLRTAPVEPEPVRDPQVEIDRLHRQLVEHPQDTEARESLALLYAEDLGRLDWAVAELEKLMALPNQPAKQVSRWLHLMADIQIRRAGDEVAARATLQRVISLFPESALAAKAQSRIEHLKLELRGLQRTQPLRGRLSAD